MTNRTHHLLDLLCAGRATASWLAHALGCGLRTVYREVARLRAMGWDVAAAPGPHGGFWLAPGSRPAPAQLSADAVREAALALAVLGRLQGGATATGVGALQGVLAALPFHDRRGLQALLASLEVSGVPTGPAAVTAPPATLDALQVALAGKQEILCVTSVGPERIAPTGLALRGGRWFAIGTGLRSPGRRTDHPAMPLPLADLRHVRVRPRLVDRGWRSRPPRVPDPEPSR